METFIQFLNSFFASLSSELAFILGIASTRLKLVYKIIKGPFALIFLFMRLVTIYSHLKRLQRRKLLWLYAWRIVKGILFMIIFLIIFASILLLFTSCSTKYVRVNKVMDTRIYDNNITQDELNSSSDKVVSNSKLDSIVTSFNLKIMRKNLFAINPMYTASDKGLENRKIAKTTKRNILQLVRKKGLPAALAYHNDSLLQKFDLVDDRKHDVTLSQYDKDIAAIDSDSACSMSVGKQCAAVNVLLKGKLHLIRNLKLYLARHNISGSTLVVGDTKASMKLNEWLSKNNLYIKLYGKFASQPVEYLILDNTKLFKLLTKKFIKASKVNSYLVENIHISNVEFLYSKSKLVRFTTRNKAIKLTTDVVDDKFISAIISTINQLLILDNLRSSCNELTKTCFQDNLLLKVWPKSKFNIFKNTIKGTINE